MEKTDRESYSGVPEGKARCPHGDLPTITEIEVVGEELPRIKYRVVISGDRNWPRGGHHQKRVENSLTLLSYGCPPSSTLIIHGDCKGADKAVGETAAQMGYHVRAYPAEWSKYGKAAGPIRNQQMITDAQKEGGVSLILIFHDNLALSRGTKSFVNSAVKAGLGTLIRMCP